MCIYNNKLHHSVPKFYQKKYCLTLYWAPLWHTFAHHQLVPRPRCGIGLMLINVWKRRDRGQVQIAETKVGTPRCNYHVKWVKFVSKESPQWPQSKSDTCAAVPESAPNGRSIFVSRRQWLAGWRVRRDMCTQREEGGPFLPQVSDFKEVFSFHAAFITFWATYFRTAKLSAVVGLAINLSCRQSKLIYRL